MAEMLITRKAGSLGKESGLRVLVPNCIEEAPAKVLYLLHGLSDDQSCWMRYSSLELFARTRNLVVVMPEGGRSFYADLPSGERYFTYLTQELPEWITGLLPVSRKREDTFIAGLSMGGYGALKAALTYPERYGGVAVFSAVCDVRRHFEDGSLPFRAAVGDQPDWDAVDLYRLAERADWAEQKPKIYQWCGFSDFLYQDNLRFRDRMEQLAFDYHFFESEGDHMWQYWNEQIARAMDFFEL